MSPSATYYPSASEFADLAKSHDIVPVFRQLLADHLTPVMALAALSTSTHAFLLESVVGGERIGRYSFLATSPSHVYSATQGHATLVSPTGTKRFPTKDPLADLRTLLPKKSFHRDPRLPAFTGGLVGFASYDTVRYSEPEKLASPPPDDRSLPDLVFGLYGELVVFDHVDKTLKVIANADTKTPNSYTDACRRIDTLVAQLSKAIPGAPLDINPRHKATLPFQSNMTRAQFEAAVEKAQSYIRAGDIFQVVPSQRLRVESRATPLDVYRALRVINPSPFMFYLKCPECVLIGSSPEILCRVQDGIATTRPLAGTRKRGATAEEDARLEAELLADPKERAEHIMLVDLHRNDLGRVAVIGSVQISDRMTVERYSHVMHITTHVSAHLRPDCDAFDALAVSLPVGTVSGAPKIRAMQIIDELEPTRRGPYGGAVGYLDLAGNMDTCIALRTIVVRQTAPNTYTYDLQAGCGVVADSVPASEYEETISKAKALLTAVEVAGS
jgi:anthranilate synthase component 1